MELHQISQVAIQGLSNSSLQNTTAKPAIDRPSENTSGSGASRHSGRQPTSQDPVQISAQGRELSQRSNSEATQSDNTIQSGPGSAPEEGLDAQDQAQLMKLRQRDSEVRRHEQAHLAAAGQYARGGPSFSLQRGPDGKSYAVGGEVGIDVSEESTPEATIAKMQTIRRAALAPASPSSADRQIAAQASVKEARARQEIAQANQEELLEGTIAPDSSISQSPESNDTSPINEASPSPNYSALKDKISAYTAIANGE